MPLTGYDRIVGLLTGDATAADIAANDADAEAVSLLQELIGQVPQPPEQFCATTSRTVEG